MTNHQTTNNVKRVTMLFRRKTNPPKLSRQQSLSSKIVRSPQASERVTEAGSLELTLRAMPAKWTRLLGRPTDVPVLLRYELDELGRYVWEQCASVLTVEQLIRQFAQHHGMNLREAEVSVLTFLQTLMKRGLIGVDPPDAA